jgi:hypothetical protein
MVYGFRGLGKGGGVGERKTKTIFKKKTVTSEKFKTLIADSLSRSNAEMRLQLNHKWFIFLFSFKCFKNRSFRIKNHRVHRVAMATVWRVFHHDGKISPGWWGWGVALPLSLYSIYHHKQSSGVRFCWEGRYTPPTSPLPLYVLCGQNNPQNRARDRALRGEGKGKGREGRGGDSEYWMMYRGTGFLAVVWFGSSPIPSPLLPSASCLSFSIFLCVAVRAYWREREGGWWGRSQIIKPWQSLVLYKSFNTLWGGDLQTTVKIGDLGLRLNLTWAKIGKTSEWDQKRLYVYLTETTIAF